MSGVVLRCPNCGTNQDKLGECEACHEPSVRYFCTNHDPGRWLDGPACPQCRARYGESGPTPLPRPPAQEPTATRRRTPPPEPTPSPSRSARPGSTPVSERALRDEPSAALGSTARRLLSRDERPTGASLAAVTCRAGRTFCVTQPGCAGARLRTTGSMRPRCERPSQAAGEQLF